MSETEDDNTDLDQQERDTDTDGVGNTDLSDDEKVTKDEENNDNTNNQTNEANEEKTIKEVNENEDENKDEEENKDGEENKNNMDDIDEDDEKEKDKNDDEEGKEDVYDKEQRNQSAKSLRSRPSTKSSRVSVDISKEPEADIEKIEELPNGCLSLFLSNPTLEIFKMKVDDSLPKLPTLKYLKKEDIIADMLARAAISDFSPIKAEIKAYDGEDILLLYDHTFKFGNNFIVAISEKAKETILDLVMVLPVIPGESGKTTPAEDAIPSMLTGSYVAPTPKSWICLGSDAEIKDHLIVLSRPLIRTIVQRPRRHFGTSLNILSQPSVGYEEVTSYEDNSFCLRPLEVDKNESNAPIQVVKATNTTWKYPRNAYTQYEPRQLNDEECQSHVESEALEKDFENALPYLLEAIQHNEITNYFYDDYTEMAPGDTLFDNKTDNDLKEFQTFADLKIGKEKAVTHIEWHPTIKGIIATSMAEKSSFDQRVDNYSKVILNKCYIILWSFLDPIEPQLLLEAPSDLYCFKFNPTDPHYVAGGCYSGQLVLWDIEEFVDDLKNVKTKMKTRNAIPMFSFDGNDGPKIPHIRCSAVSNSESSHTMPIMDLKWLPDHYEVNNLGYSKENMSQKCVQIVTAAGDSRILFWDIRQNKAVVGAADKASQQIPTPAGVPETFRFLDMKWKPTLRVNVYRTGPGGDYAPTKFSLKEVQGDRRVLDVLEDKENKPEEPTGTKGQKDRTLQQVSTYIYVGTEDGELVRVDWMPQKDQDTGKLQTTKPENAWSCHDGPVTCVTRCPFDRGLILVVGGWIWSLWKEGVYSGPILQSSTDVRPLTGGAWSPTRSSVFFIIRSDGNIEIWDLLDKTHEPTLVQNVSSNSSLTCVNVYNFVKKQLIGIGDINGGLHVYEVPLRFKQHLPSEQIDTAKYIDREVRRRAFVQSRWNLREHEKIEKESEAKRKAGIAPQVTPSDEEIKIKMKADYDAFLQEEQVFLRELGLKEDDDDDDDDGGKV